MLLFEWASRFEVVGFKLAEGKGLREGWDSKKLWKSVEKAKDSDAISWSRAVEMGRVKTRSLKTEGCGTRPYIVPYRVRGEAVEILRVFHAARRWPEKL